MDAPLFNINDPLPAPPTNQPPHPTSGGSGADVDPYDSSGVDTADRSVCCDSDSSSDGSHRFHQLHSPQNPTERSSMMYSSASADSLHPSSWDEYSTDSDG
ncbi:hypothetical protein STCU_11703 [Strigomonas culicis]|uniref:Uncharacterized protein n=1 Tax=Strigomonas culicis TaxID=28005 RepID=S9TFY9_9TRYP|nr:hypothetical protein STCU_11703 [Strigomonas culicis]|eukprot:EPY15874.1 hypothetical protein STCU_11703 [Strigomonas culicis]